MWYNSTEEEIIKTFNRDKIDYWINSFGGCRSNFVYKLLSKNFRLNSKAYHLKGSHYYRPLPVKIKAGIFLYIEDVGIALISQLKRKRHFRKIKDNEWDISMNAKVYLKELLDYIKKYE